MQISDYEYIITGYLNKEDLDMNKQSYYQTKQTVEEANAVIDDLVESLPRTGYVRIGWQSDRNYTEEFSIDSNVVIYF